MATKSRSSTTELKRKLATCAAELKASRDQQKATAEILRVISGLPSDVIPVLQSIAEHAMRLCQSHDARVWLADGDKVRYVTGCGSLPPVKEGDTLLIDRRSVQGRAIVDRKPIHIKDAATVSEDEFPVVRQFQRRHGHRTALAVPLMREERAVGVIALRRTVVEPFTKRQIALVRTFADQAAIAIENVRLSNETKEALAQQTATSDILRIISASPTDTQPVFDAIVKSCVHLLGSMNATLRLVKGDRAELVASTSSLHETAEDFPVPLDDDGIPVSRAILRREVVQVSDAFVGEWASPRFKQRAEQRGFRAIMVAPMLREDKVIGTINVTRATPGPFTDKQVALLKTFADQAVIAIENVRLFNETKEALEQQTVISEILRVISSSPTDTQPVFDAIVKSGVHLFSGMNVSLRLVKGDHTETMASTSPVVDTGGILRVPLSDEQFPSHRAIRCRQVVHIPDVLAEEWVSAALKQRSEQRGFRATLTAPMLRECEAIGTISVLRATPGPFTEKQFALLKTFADQAVIAIENVRLFKELQARNAEITEALEQQMATAEILRVISSSPTDLQPVFDTILANATRLCEAHRGALHLYDGDAFTLVAEQGASVAFSEFREKGPHRPGPLTGLGQLGAGKRVIHITDLAQAPGYANRDPIVVASVELEGTRTYLAVPMLKEGSLIGAITFRRQEVRLFTDKQIALVKTFADQAVIAIENVRLFKELQVRNAEITKALEQQTATAEILRAISGSPTDAQPVFDVIASSACRLIGGVTCAVRRLVGGELELVAYTATTKAADQLLLAHSRVALSEHPTMQQVLQRRAPVVMEDIEHDPRLTHSYLEVMRARGLRSNVAVPMMREGEVIGVIGVSRSTPGPFAADDIALLQTFADQAVIAIENVRLFKELQARNVEVTEALEQQTATAEILKVISNSPTDVQPVFDAIVQSGVRLFEGAAVAVALPDGDQVRAAAIAEGDPERAAMWKSRFPFPLTREYMHGAAILDCKAVDIPDARQAAGAWEAGVKNFLASGYRAITIMPMFRGKGAIGAISVLRLKAGALSSKQMALLQTFADQAVIAIENVRLFNETKEALEQQTVISDILRVISSSPTDTQPVFDAIVKSGVHLFGGMNVSLLLVKGDQVERVASTIPLDADDDLRFPLSDDGSNSARAILRREVVQVPDLFVENRASEATRRRAEREGFRALLSAPMLRENNAIGAITVSRATSGPFTEKQIALLKTFADQAVIAIENVRLFNEINEALEQQTATAEILRVISGSLTDTQPVFDAIVKSGAHLLGGVNVSLRLVKGDQVELAASTIPPVDVRDLASVPLNDDRYPHTRAILRREVVQVPDIFAEDWIDESVKRRAERRGFRALVTAPMLRENNAIGAIIVTRAATGLFTDKQVALLKTFADQAVIAIENVRLFKEINEALERQTATSEVLKVISRSTFDLAPVLETLVENARKLCDADTATITRADKDGNYAPVAMSALESKPDYVAYAQRHPICPDRGTAIGRAVLDRCPVHIPDVLADPDYARADLVEQRGFRSALAVPMLREGEPIGVFGLTRTKEVRPFTDKQVELVTTFADQAVIAIENVRLFNEIQDKSRELEIANKHKSEFLANMSHELRTPLNAIIGFSEVLGERYFGELNEKQAEYVSDIQGSGKHLLSLINDILDLSKIEAGRMELELSEFDLPAALQNALTLVKERAQRHGIRLGLTTDPALGMFSGDERKFKQVMLNLLSNAVKFTAEGGSVAVAARKFDSAVEISVTDTGVGIAAADQEAVFEEFKQVGRDYTRKAEGTGLGLALTKRFVELHGGTIRLESTPGKGSTFTVMLPIHHVQ